MVIKEQRSRVPTPVPTPTTSPPTESASEHVSPLPTPDLSQAADLVSELAPTQPAGPVANEAKSPLDDDGDFPSYDGLSMSHVIVLCVLKI